MGFSQHNSIPPPAVMAPAMERVCPECGTRFGPAANPRELETCPNDGLALISLSEWKKAQGDMLLGRTIAGRFVVMGRLGSGSMGAVYRAWQPTMGRWVALKVMRYDRVSDAEARARFEREARAMSRLVSPNTVRVYDFGQAEDGSVFLSMELLEGESLGDRLKREGRLPITQAVQIAQDALVSLAEAHAKGIIHRDLKPDNLFLARVPDTSGGDSLEVCKLLDFGIAKVIREEQYVDALETQAGTVFGTPRYMSPEQAQGKPLDPRTDLYSLGVILYQMITGVPPFDDDDAVVVMAAHIKTKPPPLLQTAPDLNIPPRLERVIMRALAKDPDDRPASADVFIRALEAVDFGELATIPPAARSGMRAINVEADDPLPTIAPSIIKRRRLLLGIGAAVFVSTLLVALLVLFGTRMRQRRTMAAASPPATQSRTIPPASSAASTQPTDEDTTTFTTATADASANEAGTSGQSNPKTSPKRVPVQRRTAPPRKTHPPPKATAKTRPPKRYERFE